MQHIDIRPGQGRSDPTRSDHAPAGDTKAGTAGRDHRAGPEAAAPPRLRRITGAVCLPLLPLAMLATGPLDPFDDSAASVTQLRQMGGHVAQVRTLGLVEVIAALLLGGALLAFAGRTRVRGRGLANAGVVLGLLGAAGMVLVAANHWVFVAVSGLPQAQAAAVVDGLHQAGGPLVLVLLMSAPPALVLLVLAAYRAGLAPLPAVLLAAAFFAGELVPGLPGGEVGPLVLLLAALGWTAVGFARPVPVSTGPGGTPVSA